MSNFSLAVATILSLSAGTAMAKPVPVTQQTQIASTQIDIRGSHEIRDHRLLAGGGGEYLGTTTGAHATQPADLDQEPESINQGTEP
jgi:hypothetical protein